MLPAALPALFSATLSPALLVYLPERGAARSAGGQTACPFGPTLRQSPSCYGNASLSPLRPGCLSLPLLPVWMNVNFFFSLVSDFLAVRFSVSSGCARRRMCLPTPPSWFSVLLKFK